MSKKRVTLYTVESVGALFFVIITFGGFERVFGSVGFVFAMLAVLGLFAVVVLAESIRKRYLSHSGSS
jgi:hypothetical protein